MALASNKPLKQMNYTAIFTPTDKPNFQPLAIDAPTFCIIWPDGARSSQRPSRILLSF